jgi:hypothetical protein
MRSDIVPWRRGRAPSRHHHCLLQIRRPVWHFAWPDLRDRAESQESGHNVMRPNRIGKFPVGWCQLAGCQNCLTLASRAARGKSGGLTDHPICNVGKMRENIDPSAAERVAGRAQIECLRAVQRANRV